MKTTTSKIKPMIVTCHPPLTDEEKQNLRERYAHMSKSAWFQDAYSGKSVDDYAK